MLEQSGVNFVQLKKRLTKSFFITQTLYLVQQSVVIMQDIHL